MQLIAGREKQSLFQDEGRSYKSGLCALQDLQPVRKGVMIGMQVIIDRFEGVFAVCEDEGRRIVNIEKARLPEGAKEGTVMIVQGDKIEIDHYETEKRKDMIKKMMDSLWE